MPKSHRATFALILLVLITGLVACEPSAPTRPDLVLITVDRLAADRLRCFGGAEEAGGSICALGQRGILFAWTASEGRGEASGAATVLTGLPESIHGVGHDGQSFLANSHASIAEDLSRSGYVTAAFVTSPHVNRSRRLDRGFDIYNDRLASPSRSGLAINTESSGSSRSVILSDMVRTWIDTAPSPWFLWIHADRDDGLVELDRLISRLSQTFDDGPGILFLALRGEPDPSQTTSRDHAIDWRTHRVPLIWRPPTLDQPDDRAPSAISVTRELASLMDVAPTLRAAAHLSLPPGPTGRTGVSPNAPLPLRRKGRDLNPYAISHGSPDTRGERFILLGTTEVGGDVGLASQNYLYTRRSSPLDGTGQPVETSSLMPLAARFAALPKSDGLHGSAPDSARLEPGPWRRDVLDAESPVPRLEFHLARQLGTQRAEREITRPKVGLR